jgi:hypothetical protein
MLRKLRKRRRGGRLLSAADCSQCAEAAGVRASQSAIQCLPVRPRISLICLTIRVTSRSALKKAAEVMPDVRKKAVALLLAWARSA